MSDSDKRLTRRDAYELITARILTALEKDTVPWHQPWTGQPPANLMTKKPYRGVNVLVLRCTTFASPWWATFKQVKLLGGYVRRGERGCPICYWQWPDRPEDDAVDEDADPPRRAIPLLRHYVVFNAEQCRGIARRLPPPRTTTVEPIAPAEAIVAEMPNPPRLQHRTLWPTYHIGLDLVTIPDLAEFDQPEEYYSTLFHELAHSTGHHSRLNRPTVTDARPFRLTNYSKEELTAEMAAAFLCGHAGIENNTVDNSAAYVSHWYDRLSQDRRMLIHAASAAQKAADYILGDGECTPDASEGRSP